MNIGRDQIETDFLQNNNSAEYITSHKVAVLWFIAEYIKLRDDKLDNRPELMRPTISPKIIRDFALLALNLIHGPDLTFTEFNTLLTSGKYELIPGHVDNFIQRVKDITKYGLNSFMNLHEFWTTKVQRSPTQLRKQFLVFKTSVIGFYVRRFFVSVEKLEFSELIRIVDNFKAYYESAYEAVQDETVTNSSDMMDLTNMSITGEDTTALGLLSKANHLYVDIDNNRCSQRQAELFIATQVALLKNNEEAALEPAVLQEKIRSLLKNNPGFSAAHYLSYINCLRVKEFCGAMDSLYHSFDRKSLINGGKNSGSDEKRDNFRYAALNLAILHAQFNHKEEALIALREAVMKAQEANDNFCLQHALTWMCKLTDENKEVLIERSILKSNELNLNYNTSLGIQAYTQHMSLYGGTPKYIFDLLTKSDVINCQHSMIQLHSNSYAQKASLWKLYGKEDLYTLWSQILLHLKSDHVIRGSVTYNGEGICQAICNLATSFTMNGDYVTAHIILNHARERFANEPLSHIWMYCEYVSCFHQAYHNQLWSDAVASAKKIASFDEWESRLYLAEVHLARNNYPAVTSNAQAVLNHVQITTESNRIHLKIRAMILLVETKYGQFKHRDIASEVLMMLNEILDIAEQYYLKYYVALVQLHIAHVQLWMRMPQHSLQLVNKSLITILANGNLYDQGRGLLLYVKCLVAKVNSTDDPNRFEEILNCALLLNKVKTCFEKIQAYSRMKDVLYVQAKLYHFVGKTDERNRCAAELKSLIEKYPTIVEEKLLVTSL